MKEYSPILSMDIVNELYSLIPEQQALALLAQGMHKNISDEETQGMIQKVIDDIDWEPHREKLSKLLCALIPIEQLVPDCYADWRPVVRDSMLFITTKLSSDRFIRKFIEQLMLPESASLEQRLISFIEQMPSLQKLGQVIARNRNLDPNFRSELIQLENEIRDIEPEQISAVIKEQLGNKLDTYQVEIEEMIHAEASVCALMRFTWKDKAKNKQQGVFKVLKPYIKDYFNEEMQLLQSLARFLEDKKSAHVLNKVNLYDLFNDIHNLLEQELDSKKEQANLKLGYNHYKTVNGVRVPRLIKQLTVPGIIAMSFEKGTKVTSAFINKTTERKILACRIIESLVAVPLFAKDDAFFHADPHAGNLMVDEESNELIILDWALTEHLSREQRRKILLLISAVILRDEVLATKAVSELSKDTTSNDLVANHISQFIKELSTYNIPNIKDVLRLLDGLLLIGVSFSKQLLLFRKVILTLDGVMNDVASEISMEAILTGYILEKWLNEIYGLNLLQQNESNFQVPLSASDAMSLAWSAQMYGYRAALLTTQQIFKKHND